MLNLISFQSDDYIEIQWKLLLNAAGINASEAKQPMGLVNSDGLVMVTDVLYSLDRVGLCFENDSVQLLHNHLSSVPFSLNPDSGILFFRLPYENVTSTVSNLYLKFINQIIFSVYDACLKMFIYAYEHLSARQYDNQSLLKIETIQSQFSEIYTLLETIKCFVSGLNNKETINYLISLLLDILLKIAKLCGARAVLKNNALELLFHLKLFQRFIATPIGE